MSCSCLVLFSGFLFVGESDKDDAIFEALAGICLTIIIVSFLYIGKVIFSKLEEIFHCWNCRKVPIVAAPSFTTINQIAKTMRTEIIAGHQSTAAGMTQPTSATPTTRKVAGLAIEQVASPQTDLRLLSPSNIIVGNPASPSIANPSRIGAAPDHAKPPSTGSSSASSSASSSLRHQPSSSRAKSSYGAGGGGGGHFKIIANPVGKVSREASRSSGSSKNQIEGATATQPNAK